MMNIQRNQFIVPNAEKILMHSIWIKEQIIMNLSGGIMIDALERENSKVSFVLNYLSLVP